jgi:ABC-type uncharacterized transport system auxiliary subunit
MKPFTLAGKPAAAIAVALLAAAGLAGCGSSGNDNVTSTPTTPVPVIDAFFAAVSGIVSASADATEGNTIEAIVATLPEDTEPEPLG